MNAMSHPSSFDGSAARTDEEIIADWLACHTPTPCPAVACAPIQGGHHMLVAVTAPKRRGRPRKQQSRSGSRASGVRRAKFQIKLSWLKQTYLADPTAENLRRIASERHCGVWYVKKRLRAAGVHDVHTASRMEKPK
jgi:hypothetical protein